MHQYIDEYEHRLSFYSNFKQKVSKLKKKKKKKTRERSVLSDFRKCKQSTNINKQRSIFKALSRHLVGSTRGSKMALERLLNVFMIVHVWENLGLVSVALGMCMFFIFSTYCRRKCLHLTCSPPYST